MILMHGSVKKMARSVSASCRYARDLYGRELKGFFSDNPKDGHISLDEGSLLSSKSKT